MHRLNPFWRGRLHTAWVSRVARFIGKGHAKASLSGTTTNSRFPRFSIILVFASKESWRLYPYGKGVFI